jgi:hypothetical protein
VRFLQGLHPLWALAHIGVLVLCATVGLSGMVVALVRFGNTITGLLMSTHQVLGIISVGEWFERHDTALQGTGKACCSTRCPPLPLSVQKAATQPGTGWCSCRSSAGHEPCGRPNSLQIAAAVLRACRPGSSLPRRRNTTTCFCHHHPCAAGLSLVLVIMYGLRPLLVSGHKHAPSPLVALQKAGGVIAVAAGWASLFLGCVVIHQNWVGGDW